MRFRKHIYLLLICLILSTFASCSKNSQNGEDGIYYGSDKQKSTVTVAETVGYSVEKNKVITDDYSFELPEGYEVKGNENYISASSNASEINVSLDSYTDNKITLEEYIQKRRNEIYKTGYEISEPKEIEINGIKFTELRIGMHGRSETDPIGCEYIYEGESGIVSVRTSGNGLSSIDIAESEKLIEQLNLRIK